ncbi:hypothetical protein ACNVED_07785 [Legionella sp. D16C41]|uniref:hypothetical protein n=1 Tax=Legionella sp. D16C41 TaxID=3402688 RepID=UPI003AF5D2D5
MKISLYIEIPDRKDKYEFRSFEVEDESLIQEIKQKITDCAEPADSEIHVMCSHIIVGDEHYEFDINKQKANKAYKDIRAKLLKSEAKKPTPAKNLREDYIYSYEPYEERVGEPEVLLRKEENKQEKEEEALFEVKATEEPLELQIEPESQPFIQSVARPATTQPIITISFDKIEKPKQSVTAEVVIAEFLDSFNQSLEPFYKLGNTYLSQAGRSIIEQFPDNLAKFDINAFLQAIAKIDSNLNLSFADESEDEKEEKLLQKKQVIEKQWQYIDAIQKIVSATKGKRYLVQESRFKKNIGQTKEDEFQTNYQAIDNALTQFKSILGAQLTQVQTEIEKISEKKLENSIIIRTWYASESDEEEHRQLFGIPSGGHTTIEFYRNKNDRVYLGFYVFPNQPKSTIGNFLNRCGFPAITDTAKGYFVDLEHDRSLVGKGKKFARCEETIIKCNRPGAELNFDAGYQWAANTLGKYPQVEVSSSTNKKTFRIINDYKIVTNNCATYGKEGLSKVGAGAIIPYFDKQLTIATPPEVRKNTQELEKQLAIKAKKYIEDEENKVITNSQTPQAKYSCYLGFAIDRLKLISTDDYQLHHVLKSLVEQFETVKINISELPDIEVKDYIDTLFEDLHKVINQFIQKGKDVKDYAKMQDFDFKGSEEAIRIIKHLASLMPPSAINFIKIINLGIEHNLYPYRAFLVDNKLANFNDLFLKMNNKIQAIITLDDKSLFDKTLQIKTGFLQLNHLYQQAINEHKQLKKQFKKNPEKLEQIKIDFQYLTRYYYATQEQLRTALEELQKELYFRPEYLLGEPNLQLQRLQKLFLPTDLNITQLSIQNLLQGAKSINTWNWADAHKPLNQLNDADKSNIFLKSIDSTTDAPKKPFVLAFWNWPKRHQHFELENKAKLYLIINNDQLSWKTKLQKINKLVADNKPSVLKFWRRAERQRYDNMGAQAALICLVQAFSEARLSEIQLAREIEKIMPVMEGKQCHAISQFKTDLVKKYQGEISVHNQPNHARMLRKLLKATANEGLEHGDIMDDLGITLYAIHHYGRLDKTNTTIKDPHEQVEIETGLWNRLS